MSRKKNGVSQLIYPNGMLMDTDGVWSGTPTKPGTYWLQVWVNGEPGSIASHRDYLWTVTGEDLSGGKGWQTASCG